MDFINNIIEESKHNSTIKIGSKYVYVRKFPPHTTLKWSKREILKDNVKIIKMNID